MIKSPAKSLNVNWKDWRAWLWLFGIFTLIEAFDTLRLIVTLFESGSDQQINYALSFPYLGRNLIETYVVALLVPFFWTLCSRFHFQKLRCWAWAPLNLLLIAGFVILHQYTFRLLFWGIDQSVRGDVAYSFIDSMSGWYWVTSLGISVYFFLLLAAFYGIDAYRRWQERELESAHLSEQLAKARLQALQTQIQPHFLFNTLQTIAILTHKEPETAEQMLVKLGDLLRSVMDNEEKPLVTLKQELDFVRQYLEIQQIRFGDRLIITWEIEPESESLQVPTMLLQPVVENAIEHGISRNSIPGEISLSTKSNTDHMLLKVEDNGNGSPRISKQGRGLANTQRRLETLYGDDASLDFVSTTLGGASVMIKIPVNRPTGDGG